jgi:4-diphosphocytidyl-2-C-methyl-D-erythritol kinase
MALVDLTRLSPAKINLMLRIVGRRADGYHDLQTLFQLLNWGDQMRFVQLNDQGHKHITISGFSDLPDEDNLIYRAAMKLQPWARQSSDWHITVDKHIPQGAGLGGGSSNAATTLMVLNEYWHCGLNQQQLMALGVELGADVPVFIYGRSALATGVGDQLTEWMVDTPFVLLVLPEIHINTAKLFSHQGLTRDQQVLNPDQLHQQDLWINDFFPLLIRLNPEIAGLFEQLKQVMPVRLSGTGSAMFAVYKDKEQAETALKSLPAGLNSRLVVPLSAAAG